MDETNICFELLITGHHWKKTKKRTCQAVFLVHTCVLLLITGVSAFVNTWLISNVGGLLAFLGMTCFTLGQVHC